MSDKDRSLSQICREHKQRQDEYQAEIVAQLRQLGYHPHSWDEAWKIAKRLTRRRH